MRKLVILAAFPILVGGSAWAQEAPPLIVNDRPVARLTDADAHVRFDCEVLKPDGSTFSLVVEKAGREGYYGEAPDLDDPNPYIPKPRYSLVSSQDPRFASLVFDPSRRFEGEAGDAVFLDAAGIPQAVIRLDELYDHQKDRAISMFVPDASGTSVETFAGICQFDRYIPSSGLKDSLK